ncbi:hypothetical protein HYE68_001690 [Fusarium pseudograminearum]|nr:hypothetical protein HYE68_001690 [Fusarium pseudograminearum]
MHSSWEAEFSSSRHIHNRGSRKPKSQTANISNIFGVYEIQCAKAENISLGPSLANRKKPKRQSGPRLTIQSFTADEHGLVGTLHLPGVLDAEVHMSGSRKKLQEILDADNTSDDDLGSREDLDTEHDNHETGTESAATSSNAGPPQHSEDANDSHGSEISTQEDREQSRFAKFEKNTFRQPKFWLFWKGTVLVLPDNTTQASADNMVKSVPNEPQSGMGYIVFNGNGYKRFNGTISCDVLEWRDVAFSGRKE